MKLGYWCALTGWLLILPHAQAAQPDVKKEEPKKEAAIQAQTREGPRVSLSTHITEIRRRLADKSAATRRTAMPLLEEVKRDESGATLLDLALFDVDPEIRMEAFRQLCLFPDRDGKIARHLSQVFRKEPSPWAKQSMALNMSRLPFKHAAISELVYYIVAMRDPDNAVWDDQYDSHGKIGGGGGGGRGGRAHFSLIVQALNAASGRNFPASRDTSSQVNDWWKVNEYDYRKMDADLATKIQKEGAVGFNLVPSSVASTAAVEEARAQEEARKKRAAEATRGGKELAGILGEEEEEPVRKAEPKTEPVEKKTPKPLTVDDIE